MSSVTSAGLAQIPRNSHFRATPYALADRGAISASILAFTATSGVAPVLTQNNTSLGATGGFAPAAWVQPAAAAYSGQGATSTPYGILSAGAGLLKDLGDTIVSAGRTFRRVQLMNPFTTDERMGGTYTGTSDADANVGYIEVGFRGGAFPGPFVRAY